VSGGTFNNSGYIFYQVDQFADELELEILNNSRKDEYGFSRNFDEKTLDDLRNRIPEIRRLAKIMKEIDWLYSGDTGPDDYLKRVGDIEKNK